MSDPSSMRLNKFLAHAGVASRRAVEALITAGKVQINGVTVTDLATTVDPAVDRIVCDGRVLTLDATIWLALHKPAGYTCTNADPHAEHLALDLVPQAAARHLFTVGRLDKDSEGLILITNDGDLANRLLHPRFGVTKVYRAQVAGHVQPRDLHRMEAGIWDDGETLRAVSARVHSHGKGVSTLELVLAEGRNREVRRMCDAIGHSVRRLTRVAFGPIRLAGLPAGEVRELTAREVAALRAASGDTPAAQAPRPPPGARPGPRGRRP